jgi:signal transduction histidine kinase
MSGVAQFPGRGQTVRLTLQPGLRLQIVLALAGLMLLAFVPLFFAVASLTAATVIDAREQGGLAMARAVAAQAAEAAARGGAPAIERILGTAVGAGGLDVACAFSPDGKSLACGGDPSEANALRAPPRMPAESVVVARGPKGRALEIATTASSLAVVIRLPLGDAADRGRSLVRLVALYMVTFGLALLVFAYLVLTHLIVRPVDHLVQAADRVASGARTLRVPRSGARELIELGASVQSMAEKLINEEAALILKVEELTQATTRLTVAQAQLVRSERLASVGRLAAGVAHEIGNPLAALIGMQELLLDGQLSPEAHRDFLARMRRETERIHTVVRDLLDFARPEENRSSEGSGPSVADVRAVVDDVVGLLRPQKPFRTVRIEADIPQSLEVALSAPRLTQVLLNIVLNAGAAVASTPSAEGKVVIRARRAEGGRVRIEVDDDGPGIAPELRQRLFEPFATTKDVGDGTGLGLAVCRGLVESVGGEVGVDWSYGPGARFYVVLPAPASS